MVSWPNFRTLATKKGKLLQCFLKHCYKWPDTGQHTVIKLKENCPWKGFQRRAVSLSIWNTCTSRLINTKELEDCLNYTHLAIPKSGAAAFLRPKYNVDLHLLRTYDAN